jgi:hypothetical protein
MGAPQHSTQLHMLTARVPVHVLPCAFACCPCSAAEKMGFGIAISMVLQMLLTVLGSGQEEAQKQRQQQLEMERMRRGYHRMHSARYGQGPAAAKTWRHAFWGGGTLSAAASASWGDGSYLLQQLHGGGASTLGLLSLSQQQLEVAGRLRGCRRM